MHQVVGVVELLEGLAVRVHKVRGEVSFAVGICRRLQTQLWGVQVFLEVLEGLVALLLQLEVFLCALLPWAFQVIHPVSVDLLAEASERLLSRFNFAGVSHEDPHDRFLVAFWFVESVLEVIDLLNDLGDTSVLEEGHLVNREVSSAAVVKLSRLKYDVIQAKLAFATVHNVLNLELVLQVVVIEGESIDLLIQIPLLHSPQYLLCLLQPHVFAFLNALYNQVGKVHILLWLVQILQEVKDRISLDQDILVHQVDCLGCAVVVDCSEHFETLVVDHFDQVYGFDVVGEFGRVVVDYYPRVLDYLLEVNIVLVTLLLVEPTVVVVST